MLRPSAHGRRTSAFSTVRERAALPNKGYLDSSRQEIARDVWFCVRGQGFVAVAVSENGADCRRISGLESWSSWELRAMTGSARRQPIDESGLEGHPCYRLSLRRSDLFCRHATCLCSPGWELLSLAAP
jgi:hypothetical protein